MRSSCAILTSRITPKIKARPAANMASTPAVSTPWMIMLPHSISLILSSRPEICRRDRLARQRCGRACKCDATFLQAIDAVCRLERLHNVLFDDHERAAFGKDGWQPRVEVAHNDRREPEADLIAQEKLGI